MTALPPKKPPRTLNRLQQLITELEKQSDLPVRRLNMRVASMMLAGALSRLTDEHGRPTFITKGGIAIELWLAGQARATQDVDVVLRGDPQALVDHLEEAFREPYADFSFRAGEPEALELRPHVRRVLIQVFFVGRNFNTLKVEVAPVEGSADEFQTLPAHDLSQIGLRGPDTVPVLALRWQIAQKLHAVTEAPLREGGENVRYWDMIDLQLLEALTPGPSLVEVREACEATFATRNQQAWPPAITTYPSWGDTYRTMATEMKMPITDVEEAAEAVKAFIARIAAA